MEDTQGSVVISGAHGRHPGECGYKWGTVCCRTTRLRLLIHNGYLPKRSGRLLNEKRRMTRRASKAGEVTALHSVISVAGTGHSTFVQLLMMWGFMSSDVGLTY